jgi:pyruvate/2-oxoglutarate dehydrogenase complex dihydrolipoamide acyltransferase (E2) component
MTARLETMIVEVKLPQLSMGVVDCQVTKWLHDVGARVQEGQVLVEVDTDKTVAEIDAPESGVLVEIRCSVGTVVEVGATLGLIDTGT